MRGERIKNLLFALLVTACLGVTGYTLTHTPTPPPAPFRTHTVATPLPPVSVPVPELMPDMLPDVLPDPALPEELAGWWQ